MKVRGTINTVIFDINKNYSEYLSKEFSPSQIHIIETTDNELEIAKILKKRKPDILIYDLFGSALSFDLTIKEIHKVSPKTKIIVSSFENGKEIVEFCLKLGVGGFFDKANFDFNSMIKSIKKVNAGKTVILSNNYAA